MHGYTIDPADLPPGTVTTHWTALGGTLTPPQNNTSTHVTWGNGASGNVAARFLDANGQVLGVCTLSVSINFLPQVGLTPSVRHSCVTGEEKGKVVIINGYCLDELVQFTATGGLTYTWSASGGATVESENPFAGTAMIRFSGLGPAEVCVTATGANGCQRKVCQSYVVYPLPTAGISVLSHPNANGSLSICLNESLTFEGLFSDPTPFELGGYTWTVTAANDPSTILGGGAGQFFSFTFTQSGEYDVTVTATNCLGCADNAVIRVKVNPNAAPVITCPSVVCQDGDPVPYCAPIDCTNLTWSVTGGTSSPGSTWNCINVVWNDPPANGFGLVTLTCPDALCPLPTTVEVPIIPTDLDINGPTLICDNEQDNNVYSVPNWPGCTYDWSLDPVDATLVGTASGSSYSVDLENFTGSQYTVTVTVRNIIANCTVTATLVVQVIDYSIAVSPQGNFCHDFSNGSSPTFTITPSPSGTYQVIWNISNNVHFWTTTTSNTNILNGLVFDDAFGGPGTFDVQAIILDNNGESTCPGLATTVTILPELMPITAVTGRTVICPGAIYAYTIVPPGNQYEWTVTGGTIINPANPANAATVQIQWNHNPPYGLSVRRMAGNCFSDPFTLNITVAAPPVNFSISSPDFAGCLDVPYTYVASDLQMDSYNWIVDGGMVLSGQGEHTAQIIWSPNASFYQVTLSSKRCGINYQATLQPVFNTTVPTMEGSEKVCQNTLVQYSVNPANGSAYIWYLDGEIIPGQTGPTLDINFPFVGAATIRVRIENPNGCPGFQDLVKNIMVIPNPLPYITQQGLLYCNEKGTTTLITQIASGGGNVFKWFHLEGGVYVPISQSPFLNFYTENGPNLDILYLPGSGIGMLGLFKVVVSGGECVSEATRFVSCLPVNPDPGGPIFVHFTNWEYDANCGDVRVSGQLYCPGLINSWFQVLDPSLPNPFYADPAEICNPTVTIGTFTHPGVYQVALVGEYDLDGHGPNPPVKYADIREITIPYILDFRPRVTCLNGQNGTYQVDLLNLTQQIPQFPNIEWTWTVGGSTHSNELNPPPLTINAGETVEVCLQGYVQVPDDENPGLLKDYRCTICQNISAPTNLTVSIGNVQSSTCSGLLVEPTAIVADPNLVLSYHWVFENSLVHYESNIPQPVFAPPYNGTYTLSLTVMFSNGCTATATQVVDVVFGNITGFSMPQTPAACGERILGIVIDPPTLPVTYLWSSGQTTPAITVTETGTYTVTVTETGNGCTQTVSSTLIINGPFPSGYRGRFVQCEGETVMWVQVGVIAGHTYTFTLGNQTPLTFTPMGAQNAWNVPFGPATLPAGTYPFTITAVETATGLPCETQLSGTLQVNPVPDPVSVSVTYSCAPFSALLVANQNVSWYNNGVFIANGQQIKVFAGGAYEAVATNAYGCTKSEEVNVDGPPNVSILTGCYCIEPELIKNGLAVIQPPSGTYTSWAWVLNGTTVLASCQPPTVCGSVPPLVLQANWEGDITLQVTQTYTNSDGSTVTCSATSGVFCWWIGPCDTPTCRVPEATTRTIACIEDYGTHQQYHIHWDFVDNGTTHPCNFPQNLPITGAYSGNFVMIDYSLINGYWHFEGIFNLNTNGALPIPEPFDICWEIPFCLNSTGEQCGVAQVCPKKNNPQHNDDVIIKCYEDDLPYCDNIVTTANILCDDVPNNGVTHIVKLNLTATIPATPNTIHCPKFSFYITSVTGTLPVPGGLIRVDIPFAPPMGGQHIINTEVAIPWNDQIGIDYICFQVILAHYDGCWPNDGNICTKRFCFDASELDCAPDRSSSGYRFTARCSREQGDGGVLYEYTIEFPNETDIRQCEVKNNNPNGYNTVVSFSGNQVTGTYLSYNGSLQFDDIFIVNGTHYQVEATLPDCSKGGGGKGDDKGDGRSQTGKPGASPADANLSLMPNPTSGRVLFRYNLPEGSLAEEHELVVVNALGAVQGRFDLGQSGLSSAISYDASALPNGVYQVALLHRGRAVSAQRMVVLKGD